MAKSDRVSSWLFDTNFCLQETLPTIPESQSPPTNMFKGDPRKPPQFAAGQCVFASSVPINPTQAHIAQSTSQLTSATAEKPVAGTLVSGTMMPSNFRFTITEVKPSNNDVHEHRYVIRPVEVPQWEVSESTLLGAPFKPGDQVIKKTNRAAEIEVVKETFLVWAAESKTSPRHRMVRRIPDDELSFDGDDEDEEAIIKPKVMLRLVDEMKIESVVEARKFRLADPHKDGTYFPID